MSAEALRGSADDPADNELQVLRNGPLATVYLNRPSRLNALSHGLLVALRRQLAELDADDTVRAIVLTGRGRAFSSGADLRGAPSDAENVVRSLYNPLISDMLAMNTPLVAAVNGVAAGAAVSLVLGCDLRVASDNATFQLSFVKVGLVPDAGATWMLPRAIGTARAAEMALLARPVAAQQALTWGLVNDVVAEGNAVDRATEIAMQLAQLSSSVGTTRRLLHRASSVDLSDQLDAEASAQGLAQHSDDYKEARQAFVEKRIPQFIR
jgi:2-(1,2-epoxy-1,2-dihydrophenyl)acetyl-CoA isomerase